MPQLQSQLAELRQVHQVRLSDSSADSGATGAETITTIASGATPFSLTPADSTSVLPPADQLVQQG